MLALNRRAARHLSSQFRSRTVRKEYLAVVEGKLAGSGTFRGGSALSWDFVRDIEQPRRPGLAASCLGNQTLIRLKISTGKKHQIRKTLFAAGHPIVGDARYGSKTRFRAKDIMLHALSIGCTLPQGSYEDFGKLNRTNVHGWAQVGRGGQAQFEACIPPIWMGRIGGCDDDEWKRIERMLYCTVSP